MQSISQHNTKEFIGDILKDTSGSLRWKLKLPQKTNYANVYLLKESRKFFKAPCLDLVTDEVPFTYTGGHYQARSDLLRTESRLRYATELSNKKRQDLANQWKELEAKEEKLKSSFVEFNSFLISNAHKRRRAEQKYKDKNIQKNERTEAIVAMTKNIELMKATSEGMQKNIDKFDIYEKYLRLVIDHSEFRDTISIINRFMLLEETKMYYTEKMNRMCEAFHNKQSSYTAKVHEFQVCYLQFSTELSELRHRYDEAKNKTYGWERVMENIGNKYTKIAQDMSWVGMAVRHLYEVAHYHLKEEHKKKISMDKLAHINASLKALEVIQEKLSRLHQKKDPVTSMGGRLSYAKISSRKSRVQESEASSSSTGFGIPVERPELNPDNIKKLWVKKIVKRNQPWKKPVQTLEELDVNKLTKEKFPIRLSSSKFELADVPNFELLYRRALAGIEKQKTPKRSTKNIESDSTKDSIGQSDSSRSGEQKTVTTTSISQVAEIDAGFKSEINLPVPITVRAPTALTLLEDGFDDDDRRGRTRLKKKSFQAKEIEKKFEKLSVSLNKELIEREKEKTQTLPPIYQVKENAVEISPEKHDVYFRTYKITSLKKSLGLIGARRLSNESTTSDDLSGHNNSLDARR